MRQVLSGASATSICSVSRGWFCCDFIVSCCYRVLRLKRSLVRSVRAMLWGSKWCACAVSPSLSVVCSLRLGATAGGDRSVHVCVFAQWTAIFSQTARHGAQHKFAFNAVCLARRPLENTHTVVAQCRAYKFPAVGRCVRYDWQVTASMDAPPPTHSA